MNIIWEDYLDGKYDIIVERIDYYTGMLKIMKDGESLHERTVTLAYGAQFGPDMDDVALWQDIAIAYIDSMEKNIEDPSSQAE